MMAPRPAVAHPQRSVRAPDLLAVEVQSQGHIHLNSTMIAERPWTLETLVATHLLTR